MAKRKRYPLGEFLKQFSSEAQCQEYIASLRWKAGYVCPKCDCRHTYRLSNGRYQCAQSAFAEGSTVRSNGYRSYIPTLEGYTHEHKPYDPNSGLLHWLHVVISNAKAFILGTYHGLPKENLQSYLDEFCFRFSRRFFGPALLEHLALAVGTSVQLN